MMYLHFLLHEIRRILRICIHRIQLDWKRQPCAQSAISSRGGIVSAISGMQQPNLLVDLQEIQESEKQIFKI